MLFVPVSALSCSFSCSSDSPGASGCWASVWGFRRMLVRRNLISQYHNITIFALCPQAIFSILYPLVLVSSGIRYPQVLSGIITISQFSLCVLRRVSVFGILGYSVSSGFIRYYHNITVISQCYHYIVRCPQTIFLSFDILGVSS